MNNRTVFLIIGASIIALALGGIGFLQVHKQKQDALQELELLRQQDQVKAKIAEESRKAEEARAKAQRAERDRLEQQRRLNEEQSAQERQRREQAERIKRENEERQKQKALAEQERQRQRELALAKQKEEERLAEEKVKREQEERRKRQEAEREEQERQRKTLSLNFDFDPSRGSRVDVAQVHPGDEIKISIRRRNGASSQLFATLTPYNLHRELEFNERHPNFTRRGRGRGGGGGAILKTLLKDNDRLEVPSQPDYSSESRARRKFDRTIILSIGVDSRSGPDPSRSASFPERSGARSSNEQYTVELTIYGANPWNMSPRRLF